jgi:outer membrane protein OmpA-like peptidoglycan-associated protein
MCKLRLNSLFLMCLGALISGGSKAVGPVTFIDHVPSQHEIHSAWKPLSPFNPAEPSGKQSPIQGALKTRGIEWQIQRPSAGVPSEDLSEIRNVEPLTKDAEGTSGPALAVPVNFDFGASRVSRPSLTYLDAIAQALAQDESLKVVVEGHTDSAGGPRANLLLSWERAFAVFRLLVERHRIDPARLTPVGKGSSEPLIDSDLPHPMNRRVQFRVLIPGHHCHSPKN